MSSRSPFPGETPTDQSEKLDPVVSTLPATRLDRSIVMRGSFITLESWSISTHWTSFWRNLQLLENPWLMDYFPFDEICSEEDLRKQIAHLVAEPHVILYAVLADPAHLNPTKGAGGGEGSVRHAEVLGFMAYSLAGATHREIEIGAIFAPALQRTAAATEAHYRMLNNVLEPVDLQEGRSLPYRRVSWKCNSLNTASRKAAERLGYVYEGTLRNHQIVKGRSRDTSWFSIIDTEWSSTKLALQKWLAGSNFNDHGMQVKALSHLRAEMASSFGCSNN